MNIVKRLPSSLAQRVFSYDDTYVNFYRIVMTQVLFYSLFNLNTISNINHWRPSHYSMNKKGKITCAIRQFVKDTNDDFDMDLIDTLRRHVNNLYTVRKKAPYGEKLFQSSRMFNICDFRDYLSFEKYSCVNHYNEFVYSSSCNCFVAFALILNGYPYKFNVRRWPTLEINAHYTEFYYDMYRCFHEKKCNCDY